MDFHWIKSEDGKQYALLAGYNEYEMAWLQLPNKGIWWRATIWLPGIAPTKEYAPLEFQMEDVELKVQHWFGMANTSRPAMDRPDAD